MIILKRMKDKLCQMSCGQFQVGLEGLQDARNRDLLLCLVMIFQWPSLSVINFYDFFFFFGWHANKRWPWALGKDPKSSAFLRVLGWMRFKQITMTMIDAGVSLIEVKFELEQLSISREVGSIWWVCSKRHQTCRFTENCNRYENIWKCLR